MAERRERFYLAIGTLAACVAFVVIGLFARQVALYVFSLVGIVVVAFLMIHGTVRLLHRLLETEGE